MTDLRTAAQQALKAMEWHLERGAYGADIEGVTGNLRAALAEPVQSGACIACGNRMTGSPESFVVATAEVGVTAPEGYSPQQVEALHPHKVGDKTSPPLAEPVQEPYAWMAVGGSIWRHKTSEDDVPLYTAPPQHKENT